MEIQSNPYLIWQLIPGIILLGIGLYIQSRPVKKRESNVFSALMFGGALWALATVIQLVTPNPGWQKVWTSITYLGIMVVPTSWFLLSIKLTGFAREQIEKVEKWFWAIPILFYVSLFTTDLHRTFFIASEIIDTGGYVVLSNEYGFMFYGHTAYSYAVLLSGIVILGVSLARNFKKYGSQVYGLIIGVLAPLVGNVIFLFGSLPPGFPDPTPMIFTVTGISFAWAIFGGRLLEVVPLAHDAIVQKLSSGIIILDTEKLIKDINPAAITMLGLSAKPHLNASFSELVKETPVFAEKTLEALENHPEDVPGLEFFNSETGYSIEIQCSRIEDNLGNLTGWLIQLNDISEKTRAEENLATTRETLETVLDTLQDSYFEANPDGVITYGNQAFVNTIGYSSKEELIGKHFRKISSRKSIRSVYENFGKIYETNQPIDPFDFIYRNKQGVELASEMVVSPIIEGGKTVGTRGIVRDISVRVNAEEVLREAKEAAEYRAGELAALNRISETVSRSLDLETILQSVCEDLTKIFEIRNAGIGLLTPDRTGLEIVAFHAINPEESSALGMILPFQGNRSSQDVIENKKTVVIQNVQTDPRSKPLASISKERGTKAIMIVPLLTRGNAIGTIGMPAKDPEHVFSEDEVEFAETVANQIAAAIDNAKLHKQTELALNVAEQDLEIGRQIQSGFFPEKLPKIPEWEIATHFHAARQVAGDFYDVFQFKNSKFTAFIIADVCDKGVGAALFMVLFRSLLRAFSETAVNADNVQKQLLRIVLNTNNFIAEYHGRSNMFATLFFSVLDPDEGILYYINGGHEPPVILDKDGSILQRLMPTGPAVGMFPDMDFKVEQIEIDKGDILVGFTDGVTDAKNDAGEVFSEERLLQNIAIPWTSAFSMLFELNAELKKHIGEQNQFDDITLVSFRRKPAQESSQHAICRVAQLDALDDVRNFVETVGEHNGLNHDDIFAFKLAVDEICTNIIQYGYQENKPGLFSLFFSVEGNTARLTIRDDGKYFSIEQAQVPDIDTNWDERELGGLGIYFVNELMDNVTYNRIDGINVLVLEKKLDSISQ